MKQVFAFVVRSGSLPLADESELGQYLAVFCAQAGVQPEEVAVMREVAPPLEKSASKKAAQLLLGGATMPRLTPRERQVLAKVKLGWTNKAIGAELYISERTVKAHVRGLFDKFDVVKRFDLQKML